MMDKRDIALQRACPIVAMPMYSPLEPLAQNGERIVMAANGTFLEVRRSWARFVRKVGEVNTIVPFGKLEESTTYFTTKLPRELLLQFTQWARENSHVEIGANIVWNEVTKQFRLLRSRTVHGTRSRLDYEIPDLDPHEQIVVDCHSHSTGKAFFSSTDNIDDAHAVKMAFVVGNCNAPNQTVKLRLCIRGQFTILQFQLENL
jgi:PRTRC genetic system protein A